jgi:hypothetical protein
VIAGWVVNQRTSWLYGDWFVVSVMRSPDSGLRSAAVEMYKREEIAMTPTIRAELERMAAEDSDRRVRARARAALEREIPGGNSPAQGPEQLQR